MDNEICESEDYRSKVFKMLPNLKYLDNADADGAEAEDSDGKLAFDIEWRLVWFYFLRFWLILDEDDGVDANGDAGESDEGKEWNI